MDDFLQSLTEQAYGNVYKRKLNEQNPVFQTDPMGGSGIGQNMDPNVNQKQIPNDMNMPTGEEEGQAGDSGIQLTGEQVAMLNQDLQGILYAIQRVQSVLAPTSNKGNDEMEMGNMGTPNMGGEQMPMPGGGNAVGEPPMM